MSLDPMPDAATLLRMKAEREARRGGVALVDRPDQTTKAEPVYLAPPPAPVRAARARPAPPPAPRPHACPAHPEHDEQVALFAWAASEEARHPELRWLFAVPNFAGRLGKATARHGAYLNAEGRKPGVPDVWLPVARKGYHGLVIEMKARDNRPSDAQLRWLVWLEGAGYSTHVCYSAIEAQTVLLDYLAAARLATLSPEPPHAG